MDFRPTRAGSEHGMAQLGRWLGIGVIAALVALGPLVYYRYEYTDTKRLRVVEDGKLYRSGQLSADGLTKAVLQYKIRTVLNVQDDVPEPDMMANWLNSSTIPERELCRQLGVRYIHLAPDLVSRRRTPLERPEAIDRFLEIMDDPLNHPVLLHCRAGLHRTGVLCAVYRLEYQGWSQLQALEGVKEHAFARFSSTASNDDVPPNVLADPPTQR